MISIAPISREDIDRVAHFHLPPEQMQFSAHPLDVMKTPESRDAHVIYDGEVPVGFFAIDRDYALTHDFTEPGALGLRMLSVNHADQGRGIASEASRLLSSYLHDHYPDRQQCYLTVNCRNPGAYRAYEKGGFVDTGELYHGGPVGPQHIMRLQLA
ncbi:MAG: GNAT family protein [Maritimibacter sp.]